MKPIKITNLKVVYTWLIPFGSYFIMMFWGNLLIKRKDKEKWLKIEDKNYGKTCKNHEMIHVKQAVSTKNSWMLFYLLYIKYWLFNLPIINGFDMPYKFNNFELEAYAYEKDYNYLLDKMNSTENWKQFKSLSLKDKKRLYKEYKASRLSFSTFVREKIIVK